MLGIELLRLPRYTTRRPRPAGLGCPLPVRPSSRPGRGDPLASLAAAVRLDPGDRPAPSAVTSTPGLPGQDSRSPRPPAGPCRSPCSRPGTGAAAATAGQPPALDSHDGWLWAAASATPLPQFCPDTHDPAALDGIVYLSSSWRALVLRDGAGFLGLVPDRGNTSFFAWGESYIRSLYTDVTLLAALERDALDNFANHLAHIGNRFKNPQYRQLTNEVTEFRNVFWWENITRHGNANRILEQFHAAHGTSRLFSRVIADLDAFRQQVEAQALEASVQVQATEERRSRRFEHAASVAAIAITLPALAFTALALPVQGVTAGGHELRAG